VVSGRAIRLDMLERLEDVLEKGTVEGATAEALLPKLVSLLGCGNDELREILAELGWREANVADGHSVWRRTGKREPLRGRPQRPAGRDSPFAGLADLIGGK
jgi:ATP-dependent RNA helicase SUPV3L1/SUV3